MADPTHEDPDPLARVRRQRNLRPPGIRPRQGRPRVAVNVLAFIMTLKSKGSAAGLHRLAA